MFKGSACLFAHDVVLLQLTKFEHLSAVDVLNPRYHVGPFNFVLSVQKETQVTVLAEDYVLKGLPLSKSSEINMSAFNRHRTNTVRVFSSNGLLLQA